MANKSSKKSKYSDEISKIKQLKVITKVLERGDVENAFLNSADKDSEGMQDIAVERMLNDLKPAGADNEAKVIDYLTSSPKNTAHKKSSAKPKTTKRSSKNKR